MLRRLKYCGVKVRLNAGSIRHSAYSEHTKVVIWLGLSLRLDVFHPDLICYVATACNPIAPCPQVLAPVAFAQAGKLRQQLVGTSTLQVLQRARYRQAGWYRQQHMDVVPLDGPRMNDHLVRPGCLA